MKILDKIFRNCKKSKETDEKNVQYSNSEFKFSGYPTTSVKLPSNLKYLFSISVDYNTYESKSVEIDLATGKLYILERYTYSKAGAMDGIVTSVQEINYDRLSELMPKVIEDMNKCLLDAIKKGQGSRIEMIQQDLKSYAILEKITSDNWKECIESYLSVQS